MDWADTTACLGVIMQSNIKFDEHMALEDKASRTQEAINFKQAHYYFKTSPPQDGRLLAYTSLCHPLLAKEEIGLFDSLAD